MSGFWLPNEIRHSKHADRGIENILSNLEPCPLNLSNLFQPWRRCLPCFVAPLIIQFLSICILCPGRPRPPLLTSNPINHMSTTGEYNVSWKTDSFTPVTEYRLYYRKSEVRRKSWKQLEKQSNNIYFGAETSESSSNKM